MEKKRVLIWNEYRHERESAEIAAVYPEGIHGAIARHLRETGKFDVSCAVLDDPGHGLTAERLAATDTLIWWGHKNHQDVCDAAVERVYKSVLAGMGLIVLHSAHASKIFHRLCGTDTLNLKWREDGSKEILWVVDHAHPITAGLPRDHIILEHEEMYGEAFEIPKPDELVFLSWFSGGEVFRSGVTYRRGLGKIFYFQPGHESFPTYYNPDILKVIENAAQWCAKGDIIPTVYGHYKTPVI